MNGFIKFILKILVVVLGGIALHFILPYINQFTSNKQKKDLLVYESIDHNWVSLKLELKSNHLFGVEMTVEGSVLEGVKNQDYFFQGEWKIVNSHYILKFHKEKPDLSTLNATNSNVEIIDDFTFSFPENNGSIIMWNSILRKKE